MLLRPLISSLLSDLLSPLIDPAQRIFIKLDPVLESHYTMQNPVVETGDFSYSFDIVGHVFSAEALIGNEATSDNFIRIVDNSNVRFNLGGENTTVTLSSALSTTKLFNIKVSRTGTNINVKTNDGIDDTVAAASAPTATFNVIGQRASAFFFNGIIANPDLGSGNAWKLDRATGNTEQAAGGGNDLTYAGIPESNRELFEFNAATDPDQWENISPPAQVLPAIIQVA